MLFPKSAPCLPGRKARAPHLLVLRRRYITLLAAAVIAAGIFYAVSYPSSVSAAATQRQLPVYSVQRDQKMCAISFDAAWGDGRLRRSCPGLFLRHSCGAGE
ncbi:MAG: hypothetical protein VB023_11610 [Oscillibacter sp.]|nr:hypothetical protein [Oscillibacter sp.]